jgi:lysozyme
MRQVNQAGVAFIVKEEGGCVLHEYLDIAGIPTIYVGHKILPGEKFNNTMEEGMAIFAKQLAYFERSVEYFVKVPLNDDQFTALVDFAYNEGEGAFAGSTLLKKLNAGDYAGASDQFKEWNLVHINGVLTHSQGLADRRAREDALFNKA